MSYTNGLDDPSAYFQTKIYTGNGSTQDITFDGNSNLQPDFLWLKGRSLAEGHTLQNSVSGVTKHLHSQNTDAEITDTGIVTAFNSNGFSLGDEGDVNGNTSTFVGWGWKETATAGFDIVSFTGSGSQRTVSHNLGVKPSMIIVKNRSASENWIVYDKINGAGNFMALNLTSASAASSSMFGVEPTTSVFTVGTSNATNKSSSNMIAYCFADVKGYSKVGGSYVGNGSSDGVFCFTGFKPSFLMYKASSISGQSWLIHDNKRGNQGANANPQDLRLLANATNTEADVNIDFLSNGFKARASDAHINSSGTTYIYMAFAENPFVTSTGIPTTAR